MPAVSPNETKAKDLSQATKKAKSKFNFLTNLYEFSFLKLLFSISINFFINVINLGALWDFLVPTLSLVYKKKVPKVLNSFLPMLSGVIENISFNHFSFYLSKLYSILSRKNLKHFFKFFLIFISSTKLVGVGGSLIIYKGKLSWKALSRKKRQVISKGLTSRMHLDLLADFNLTEIRNSTGRISIKTSIFFFLFYSSHCFSRFIFTKLDKTT